MKDLLSHKSKPFKVPDGYFENFPTKIMQQIQEIPPVQQNTSKILVLKRQLAFAAVFIGFFLLSYGIFKMIITTYNYPPQLTSQVSYEDLVLSNISHPDLIEFLSTEPSEETYSPETIENYLLDENIHEQLINE